MRPEELLQNPYTSKPMAIHEIYQQTKHLKKLQTKQAKSQEIIKILGYTLTKDTTRLPIR